MFLLTFYCSFRRIFKLYKSYTLYYMYFCTALSVFRQTLLYLLLNGPLFCDCFDQIRSFSHRLSSPWKLVGVSRMAQRFENHRYHAFYFKNSRLHSFERKIFTSTKTLLGYYSPLLLELESLSRGHCVDEVHAMRLGHGQPEQLALPLPALRTWEGSLNKDTIE